MNDIARIATLIWGELSLDSAERIESSNAFVSWSRTSFANQANRYMTMTPPTNPTATRPPKPARRLCSFCQSCRAQRRQPWRCSVSALTLRISSALRVPRSVQSTPHRHPRDVRRDQRPLLERHLPVLGVLVPEGRQRNGAFFVGPQQDACGRTNQHEPQPRPVAVVVDVSDQRDTWISGDVPQPSQPRCGDGLRLFVDWHVQCRAHEGKAHWHHVRRTAAIGGGQPRHPLSSQEPPRAVRQARHLFEAPAILPLCRPRLSAAFCPAAVRQPIRVCSAAWRSPPRISASSPSGCPITSSSRNVSRHRIPTAWT